jgi:type II secretory pathway component HofQ
MGQLLVRATRQDLALIQQAIEVLNQPPPPVMIETRFVEMDEAALQGLALHWNKLTHEFTGILTDKQLSKELAAIKQVPDVDILSAPKVTTESGSLAHLGSSNADGTGVTLDVIPTVGPDGYMIQIAATPTIKTSHQTWRVTASRKIFDGETMVIGGIMTNQPPGATKVGVVFITPRIMDPAGNPVHTDDDPTGKPLPDVPW